MATIAMTEMPWALNVPHRSLDVSPSVKALTPDDDDPSLLRGIIFGLAISMPVWFGLGWLVTSVVSML